MPKSKSSKNNKRSKPAKTTSSRQKSDKAVRYAVVGLGYISQIAVLPAFQHAKKNSELVALVSGDSEKLTKLGKKYKVKHLFGYDEYDQLLASGLIDAVYIALPNDMHCDYTLRAAEKGIHVLCEKPMAVNEAECHTMIHACESNDVKLMIAYRLHFEEANLKAVETVQSKKIGDAKVFNSVFSMQVQDDNIRIKAEHGGGPLYDIGIYCINAARYVFQDEPFEVLASATKSDDPRFEEVEESISAIMRFPEGRIASFTASFGAADVSSYQIVGTKGDLLVSPAYEYAGKLEHRLTKNGKTTHKKFPQRDQFAPELTHFSDCIINNKQPVSSGEQGLADIRIIEACYISLMKGQVVSVEEVDLRKRPNLDYEQRMPAVKKPKLVNAVEASK